jgi:drug/metabolite transporter (DMT)-like permease
MIISVELVLARGVGLVLGGSVGLASGLVLTRGVGLGRLPLAGFVWLVGAVMLVFDQRRCQIFCVSSGYLFERRHCCDYG